MDTSEYKSSIATRADSYGRKRTIYKRSHAAFQHMNTDDECDKCAKPVSSKQLTISSALAICTDCAVLALPLEKIAVIRDPA